MAYSSAFLINQRIGKLVVKKIFDSGIKLKKKKYYVESICDCGNTKISEERILLKTIKNGHIASCNVGKCNKRYINLDGKKFGKLLVLKSDLPGRKALVRCECGLEFETDKTSVYIGKSKSCGKGFCRPSTKDLTNKRFGFLVAKKMIGSRSTGHVNTIWECLCDCGKIINVLSHSLMTENTKSCGCKTTFIYSKIKTLPNNQCIINDIMSSYKNHAIKLKIKFLLTNTQFLNFIKSECHYCGVDSSNVRRKSHIIGESEFKYNGIDRKNSSGDYDVNNCVTACKNCNYAKRKLEYDQFLNLVRAIASKHP